MVARVARFKQQPERFTSGDYRWVLDVISRADGFEAAYHLIDEENGDSISISIFKNEDAARTAEEQVGHARQRLGVTASPPDAVEMWRVVDRTHPLGE
jgi:hypothetical protein